MKKERFLYDNTFFNICSSHIEFSTEDERNLNRALESFIKFHVGCIREPNDRSTVFYHSLVCVCGCTFLDAGGRGTEQGRGRKIEKERLRD